MAVEEVSLQKKTSIGYRLTEIHPRPQLVAPHRREIRRCLGTLYVSLLYMRHVIDCMSDFRKHKDMAVELHAFSWKVRRANES